MTDSILKTICCPTCLSSTVYYKHGLYQSAICRSCQIVILDGETFERLIDLVQKQGELISRYMADFEKIRDAAVTAQIELENMGK